jgi:hypothetical protein
MRIASSPTLRIASGLLLAVLLSVVGYQVVRRLNSHGPEGLLTRADDLSWLNSWIQAEPLYRQAEQKFIQRHQLSKALDVAVSQMPAHVCKSHPRPACRSKIEWRVRVRLFGEDLPLLQATTASPFTEERTATTNFGHVAHRAA